MQYYGRFVGYFNSGRSLTDREPNVQRRVHAGRDRGGERSGVESGSRHTKAILTGLKQGNAKFAYLARYNVLQITTRLAGHRDLGVRNDRAGRVGN